MADFNIAYNIVRDSEGGYQDYPEDRGNYNSLGQLVGTNWGISAPVYETWLGRSVSRVDMITMPLATAKKIYRSKFWGSIQGDLIRNQAVANLFFDGRVNHGKLGVKLMQRVLNVVVDGVVGSQTLAAINRKSPSYVYSAYKREREQLYRDLANNRPGHDKFLNGWLNRLARFKDFAGSTGGLLTFAGVAIAVYLIIKPKHIK